MHDLSAEFIDELKQQVRAWGAEAKAWREDPANMGERNRLKHRVKIEPDQRNPARGMRESEVTDMDIALGAKMDAFFKQHTPDIPVMNEEHPDEANIALLKSVVGHRGGVHVPPPSHIDHDQAVSARKQCSRYWTVDPIDGTGNYTKPHKKNYGILIGLVEDGTPIFGITYYPEYDMLHYVGADGKAYQQFGSNPPHEVTIEPASLAEDGSLIGSATKTVHDWFKKNENSHVTRLFRNSPLRPLSQTVRALNAVDDLCYSHADEMPKALKEASVSDVPDELAILTGQTDMAHLKGGYEWDYAARHAIIKAAGGEVLSLGRPEPGAPIRYTNMNMLKPRTVADQLYKDAAMVAHPDTFKSIGMDLKGRMQDAAPIR